MDEKQKGSKEGASPLLQTPSIFFSQITASLPPCLASSPFHSFLFLTKEKKNTQGETEEEK